MLSILVVNYNSSDFINTLLYSLERLTKNPYKVFILDNNSRWEDFQKLQKIVKKYTKCPVNLERSETQLRGSAAHAYGLNHLIQKVDTPYFVIMDADATWLIKHWDEKLIQELTNRTKIIGTQSPNENNKDFPDVFGMLIETETFKKLNINFMPQTDVTAGDTGWEMKEKYLKNGYQAKIIEFKNTRTYKNGPFRELITAEFYLNGNYQQIFASHFSRGSSLGAEKYRKNPIARIYYKIPFLGAYCLKQRGTAEKRKWIEICKKITDENAAR